MKTLLLAACLFAVAGGDREQGLQLYRDGKFREAAAAFRAAIEHDGDAADLQWNLALASWQAGDLAAAETAAEKYAALAKDARVDLHRGLLGAVRYAEAQALEAEADGMRQGAAAPPPPSAAGAAPAAPPDPLPVLEQALAKAKQAKDHFLAGAAAKPTPELLRNTERALRYVDELQKKIDELQKQREQQQKDDKKDDDKQDRKDDKKQDGDQKDENDQKQDQQQKGDQNGQQDQQDQQDQKDQQPSGGEPSEPKPKDDAGQQGELKDQEGGQQPEPKAGEQPRPQQQPPEPKPGEERHDAPGETEAAKELSPEQAQRLQEQLKQLDQKLQQLRHGSKTGRAPVGRDW